MLLVIGGTTSKVEKEMERKGEERRRRSWRRLTGTHLLLYCTVHVECRTVLYCCRWLESSTCTLGRLILNGNRRHKQGCRSLLDSARLVVWHYTYLHTVYIESKDRPFILLRASRFLFDFHPNHPPTTSDGLDNTGRYLSRPTIDQGEVITGNCTPISAFHCQCSTVVELSDQDSIFPFPYSVSLHYITLQYIPSIVVDLILTHLIRSGGINSLSFIIIILPYIHILLSFG